MKLVRFNIAEENDYLSSHAGLALIGQLLSRTQLREKLDRFGFAKNLNPSISHGDVVVAMIGLLALGKPDFDAIEAFREDDFFSYSLGIPHVPSSPTLRQRLDLGGGLFDPVIEEESARLLAKVAPALTTVETKDGARVPLDVDTSPFDNSNTKKEGVSFTYKGTWGYTPIFAYLGAEGYLAACDLREGKCHSQNGTPDFLGRAIKRAREITSQPILVRMDSGFDSRENLVIMKGFNGSERKVDWLIKRNLRGESLEDWENLAVREGHLAKESREDKQIWRGSVKREVKDVGSTRIVYEVVVRPAKDDQPSLWSDLEVSTWWTSLSGEEEEVIALYEGHGTSEQFHSELKSDMGLERLPSGRFATNGLLLTLGMMAYNLLRLCGQESLREENGRRIRRPSHRRSASRRRLRTVIQDLMYMACRLIRHARRLWLSFGRNSVWKPHWLYLYGRLQAQGPDL